MEATLYIHQALKIFRHMSKYQKEILDLDVLVLCGGLGTRVKDILGNTPKSMAKINELPFLDLIINQLKKNGIFKAIFCVGYESQKIMEHYGSRKDFICIFSKEDIPLGTGGAIKNALKHIKTESFIVLNGDSICDINFSFFRSYHLAKQAFVTIAVVENLNSNNRDFGSIFLDDNSRINSFHEKKKEEHLTCVASYINAGVYLFNKRILNFFSQKNKSFSLENDIFPEIIAKKNCFAFILKTEFYDIGTKERLANAEKNLSKFFD
jgi:NDP-sugar pyrophosphorylase family protein